MGDVVYSSELFTVVIPKVTELLCCRLRDDGGMGWGAGHGAGGSVSIWGGGRWKGIPPLFLMGGGFVFGV